jgi:hypothetical protein
MATRSFRAFAVALWAMADKKALQDDSVGGIKDLTPSSNRHPRGGGGLAIIMSAAKSRISRIPDV